MGESQCTETKAQISPALSPFALEEATCAANEELQTAGQSGGIVSKYRRRAKLPGGSESTSEKERADSLISVTLDLSESQGR